MSIKGLRALRLCQHHERMHLRDRVAAVRRSALWALCASRRGRPGRKSEGRTRGPWLLPARGPRRPFGSGVPGRQRTHACARGRSDGRYGHQGCAKLKGMNEPSAAIGGQWIKREWNRQPHSDLPWELWWHIL